MRRHVVVPVFAFALVMALFASSAQAAFVQTDSWDVPKGDGLWLSYGVTADPFSGSVFTGLEPQGNIESGPEAGEPLPGEVDKWTAAGLPGTPSSFGQSVTSTSRYGGVATHPGNGNVYALADYGAPSDADYSASGKGDLTKDSPIVTSVVTKKGTFTVGEPITGLFIPKNTTIVAVAAGTLTLSDSPTSGQKDAALYSGSPTVAAFQPDGTPVGAPIRVATGGKPVGIDVDSAGHVYVPDAAAKVVREYDASGSVLQTFDPNASGHGKLNDPSDVAVDAAGSVYISDRSTNRVAEQQTVDTHGATGGTYKLSFDGATTGATFTADVHAATGFGDVKVAGGEGDLKLLATGHGDTDTGSDEITNVTTDTGSFSVGESITNFGIRSGTTITAVGPGTLTLSEPVRSGSSGTELVSGSKVIENVSTASGTFEVGMTIEAGGAMQTSTIPGEIFATTITAVDTINETITLSAGVKSEATGATIGASSITNVTTSTGAFDASERLTAPPYFGGVFAFPIFAVNGNSITIPQVAEAAENHAPLAAGSEVMTDVHLLSGQFSPELFVSGKGIPNKQKLFNWDSGAGTLKMQPNGIFGLPVTEPSDDEEFTANLPSTGAGLDDALEALPTIGDAHRFDGNNSFPGRSSETDNASVVGSSASFKWAMGGRDLPQMTCDGNGLSGGPTPKTCDVSTNTNGSTTPGRVVKFSSAGAFLADFVPATGSYTAEAVAVDRSSGDVYVAGGNSAWGPIGGVATPSGPDYAVKRYPSSGGPALEEVGFGSLAAEAAHRSGGGLLLAGPAAGLAFDQTSHRLYSLSPTGDGSQFDSGVVRSTVSAFAQLKTLTVTPAGGSTGTVDADSGAIAGCAKSGGICADDYVFGTTVVLTASPGPNTEINWSGCDAEPSANECEVEIDGDVNVGASFDLIPHTLSVVANGTGTGTVTADSGAISNCSKSGGTCSGPYGETSTVVLTADPAPNSGVSWVGCTTSNGNECTVEIPNHDVSVEATFTLDQRTLTITKPGTGAGTVTCNGGACASSYPDGTTVTLAATPDSHSTFISWSVTGSAAVTTPCTGTTSPCEVKLEGGNVSTQATFNLTPRTLTITKPGTGAGTVTCNGGACASSYPDGTTVTLAATPDSHSTFISWSVTGSAAVTTPCTGTTSPCEVKLEGGNVSTQATFNLTPRTLTITKPGTGAGTVTCNGGACASSYPDGTTVTLAATPDSHSTFISWSVTGSAAVTTPCTGTTSPCEVKLEGGNVSTQATFNLTPRTLTITKPGTGAGTVTCNGGACASSYPDGTTVTLAATPGAHAAFGPWSVTGSAAVTTPCTGTTSPCEVKLEGNVLVSAPFNLIHHDLTVTPQGTGSGSVTADSGAIQDCTKAGGTCTGSYIEETTVVLTATPATHSRIDGWTGCDSVNPAGTQCTVAVEDDTEVKPTFTLITHSLTVTKTGTGSGSVSCDGLACAPSYPEGTKVTLAAAGDSTSTFTGWSGAGCSGSGTCTVTIDADTSLSATFTANPPQKVPSCETDPSLCKQTGKPVKCKKGFKKKKVKGKVKCVKVKKHKKHGKR